MIVSNDTLSLPFSYAFKGQTVRWGRCGSNGPAVILIHGTPFNSHVWRRIAPLLAEHYQVFYYDLLGYGQSQKSSGQDVSLGVQNEVLVELLNHWKLDRPHVVAHDFGGATALRAHLLNGAAYASLTLIDPVALVHEGTPLVQHVSQHVDAFSGAPPYVHDAILKAYLKGGTYWPMRDDQLEAYALPWTGEAGQAAFYRQIAQMDVKYNEEIAGQFDKIECPVMLLWGMEDYWIPVTQGDKLAAQIPGVTYIRVPHSAHLVQEDSPETIVAHLLHFLTR